jgi:hypothetical protein
MIDKQVRIGMDRFLALKWADYSLDLFISLDDEKKNYELLCKYLQGEIRGTETSRKTANQLKRLWLNKVDENHKLRIHAKEILRSRPQVNRSIFHLGMAINVFPVFKEVCHRIGILSKLQGSIPKQAVIDRVVEAFVNPTSIPRVVDRVLQTLIDWRFLEQEDGKIRFVELILNNDEEGLPWFVISLMKANRQDAISPQDLKVMPERMGINFLDIRKNLSAHPGFTLTRDQTGNESVALSQDITQT